MRLLKIWPIRLRLDGWWGELGYMFYEHIIILKLKGEFTIKCMHQLRTTMSTKSLDRREVMLQSAVLK